jgi:hypothetical protein
LSISSSKKRQPDFSSRLLILSNTSVTGGKRYPDASRLLLYHPDKSRRSCIKVNSDYREEGAGINSIFHSSIVGTATLRRGALLHYSITPILTFFQHSIIPFFHIFHSLKTSKVWENL